MEDRKIDPLILFKHSFRNIVKTIGLIFDKGISYRTKKQRLKPQQRINKLELHNEVLLVEITQSTMPFLLLGFISNQMEFHMVTLFLYERKQTLYRDKWLGSSKVMTMNFNVSMLKELWGIQ